jgi:hypothetical protein
MAGSQAVRSSVNCPVLLSYFLQVSQSFSHELTRSKRVNVQNMPTRLSFMPLLLYNIRLSVNPKFTKKHH